MMSVAGDMSGLRAVGRLIQSCCRALLLDSAGCRDMIGQFPRRQPARRGDYASLARRRFLVAVKFGHRRAAPELPASAAVVSHSSAPIAHLRGQPLQPNRGIPLNLDWVADVHVNTSAVERRAATLVTRRTVKKEWQAAWLLRAISCMDLTTLSGDDTAERVRRLCAKAKHPLQQHLVEQLGVGKLEIKVAAVCVYHTFVET